MTYSIAYDSFFNPCEHLKWIHQNRCVSGTTHKVHKITNFFSKSNKYFIIIIGRIYKNITLRMQSFLVYWSAYPEERESTRSAFDHAQELAQPF